MKKIKTILMLFVSLISFAQTQFSNGFQEGFKKGYCYEKGFNCLSPIAPLPPIPNIGENNNSYVDGYNRGFQVGLDKFRNENIQKITNSDRKRYTTSQPEFVENKIYKAPYELMLKVLEIKEKQHEEWLLTKEDREKSFHTNLATAKTKFQEGNYFSTIDYSKAALSNGYHNDYIYYLLGASYYNVEDFDNALFYLKKSKEIGNNDAQQFINYINEKEKTMEYIKPFQFGVKGGFNFGSVKSSFLVGVFIQGNRNIFGIKNFSGIGEIQYFQGGYSYSISGVDANYNFVEKKQESKDNILQVNLLLKNKIVDKFDIVYGTGISAGLDKQIVFLDLSAGGQYHIKHNVFADFRINKSVVGDSPNLKNLEKPFNIQLSVGYKF